MDKKITARIETLEKQNKKLRILLAEKNDKENVLRRMLAEKKVEEEKLKEENMQLRSLLAERSEKDREVDVVLETSEKGSESNDEVKFIIFYYFSRKMPQQKLKQEMLLLLKKSRLLWTGAGLLG